MAAMVRIQRVVNEKPLIFSESVEVISDHRVSFACDIKKGKENVTFVIVYVPFSQGQLFFVINLR